MESRFVYRHRFAECCNNCLLLFRNAVRGIKDQNSRRYNKDRNHNNTPHSGNLFAASHIFSPFLLNFS